MPEVNPYAAYQPPEPAGKFFKFKDNETYRLRLLDAEPYVYESTFTDKDDPRKTSVSTKYSWRVWNFDSGTEQILTLPVSGYKEVAKFGANAEYGDLRQRNFEIKRTGTGFDTRYTVVVSPKVTVLNEIDPRAIGAVGTIDLLDELQKDDKVQFPMLLSEALNKSSQPMQKKQDSAPATTADDLVSHKDTDENDNPIDLSEIPF